MVCSIWRMFATQVPSKKFNKIVQSLLFLLVPELFRGDLWYVAGLSLALFSFLVEVRPREYEDTSTDYYSTKPDSTNYQGPSNAQPMGRIELLQLFLSRVHRIISSPCAYLILVGVVLNFV